MLNLHLSGAVVELPQLQHSTVLNEFTLNLHPCWLCPPVVHPIILFLFFSAGRLLFYIPATAMLPFYGFGMNPAGDTATRNCCVCVL
jgi:hypothetical protein